MAEARSRGYFGIGVEGVSKSANVGALLRTAHAFGAAFCFIVGAGFDARAGRLADTADTPEHVPLWRFPDVEALDAAAALRAGGRRTAGRRDRSALVPPSGERRLCARTGAIRPVACHAATLPPRGANSRPASRSIWRWPARWCCTTGCCSTAASPSAPSAVAARLHPCRRPPRHGPPRFRRNIPGLGGRRDRAMIRPRLSRPISRRISPAHAPDRGFARSRPCRAGRRTGAAEAGEARKAESPRRSEGTRQVRRLDRRDASGVGPDHVLRVRPGKEFRAGAARSRRGCPDRHGTPDRPRHGGDQRRLPYPARTRR